MGSLATVVRCIDQTEFETTLNQSLNQLNEVMPEGLKYKVAVQEGKSNLWVAQLTTQSGTPHLPLPRVSNSLEEIAC